MAARIVRCFLVLACASVGSAAAQNGVPAASAPTGAQLYRAGCVSCHGPDGKGAPKSQVGFETPLPDFTNCRFASAEPDLDWASTIRLGGRARGFDRMMPAFADALTDDQIDRLIAFLRAFCTDRRWPRGNLNFPRPLVTETAFPENEAILTTTAAKGAPGAVQSQFVYEHRLGPRSQYEVVVPFNVRQQPSGKWNRGLGDVGAAFKYTVFDSLSHGLIVSAGGGLTLPTGKETEGLGDRVTIFAPFGVLTQRLPHQGFLHLHAGLEIPLNIETVNKDFSWRAAVGKTISRGCWGRSWSPMVEVLGAHELERAAGTRWDLVPELQVSLSRRQHVRVNGGVQIPLNRTGRQTTVLVSVLWDWFDGGLSEGWR